MPTTIEDHLKNSGVSPTLLQSALVKCGLNGVHTLLNGILKPAAKLFHPDSSGCEDSEFKAVSSAITALKALNESELSTLLKASQAAPKKQERTEYKDHMAYQSGTILRDLLVAHRQQPSAQLLVRQLSASVNEVPLPLANRLARVKGEYLNRKADIEGEAKPTSLRLDAIRERLRELAKETRLARQHLDYLNREISREKSLVRSLRRGHSVADHQRKLATHQADLEAARKRYAAANLAETNQRPKLEAEREELDREYAIARAKIDCRLHRLQIWREDEEKRVRQEHAAEKAARERQKKPFVLETTADGIRYRRQTADAEWQIEPGVRLFGSLSFLAKSFLTTHLASVRSNGNTLDQLLVGKMDKKLALVDPLPRILLPDVFFSGLERHFSPLVEKDEGRQRLLLATNQAGELMILGFVANRPSTNQTPA